MLKVQSVEAGRIEVKGNCELKFNVDPAASNCVFITSGGWLVRCELKGGLVKHFTIVKGGKGKAMIEPCAFMEGQASDKLILTGKADWIVMCGSDFDYVEAKPAEPKPAETPAAG